MWSHGNGLSQARQSNTTTPCTSSQVDTCISRHCVLRLWSEIAILSHAELVNILSTMTPGSNTQHFFTTPIYGCCRKLVLCRYVCITFQAYKLRATCTDNLPFLPSYKANMVSHLFWARKCNNATSGGTTALVSGTVQYIHCQECIRTQFEKEHAIP